jgi:hypothetical protein
MSRTPPAPQDTAGDARSSEDHDLAGPDGEYEIDATDDGARLVPRPAQARPPHRPLGLRLDVVDGAGMAASDRLGDFSVAVVVT